MASTVAEICRGDGLWRRLQFYFERHGHPLNRASLTGRPSPSLFQCEWLVETNVKGKGRPQKLAQLTVSFSHKFPARNILTQRKLVSRLLSMMQVCLDAVDR